jgi:hypothetical protein
MIYMSDGGSFAQNPANIYDIKEDRVEKSPPHVSLYGNNLAQIPADRKRVGGTATCNRAWKATL